MAVYRQTGKPVRDVQFQKRSRNYLNEIKKRQYKQTRLRRMFVLFFMFILAICVGFWYAALNTDFCSQTFGENSRITKFFDRLANDKGSKSNSEFTLSLGPKRKNILILGVDASEYEDDLWTGTRTDTIILLNVDSRTKSINAISIPRDSKVYLPGDNGVQKINSAHAIGGVDMTVRTIQNTLGVKIDRYIMLHDSGVKRIIEALGGVDVYVEKDMHYHDYAGHLHIDLTKGHHRLSPNQAVGYLRFRHDAMGDIGRTQRQQWFLRGLLNELKKTEVAAKLPEIVSIARKYIKTNMSLYELTQFAMTTKQLDMDKVEIATLPGAPNKRGSVSYWILDPDRTQEVINRLVYRQKVRSNAVAPMTASVVFDENKSSEAKNIIDELKTADINISCQSNISRTHSQFIAHSPRVTNEYFNHLKKSNPSIAGYQFVYDPNTYLCGDTDFTIVVAGK